MDLASFHFCHHSERSEKKNDDSSLTGKRSVGVRSVLSIETFVQGRAQEGRRDSDLFKSNLKYE